MTYCKSLSSTTVAFNTYLSCKMKLHIKFFPKKSKQTPAFQWFISTDKFLYQADFITFSSATIAKPQWATCMQDMWSNLGEGGCDGDKRNVWGRRGAWGMCSRADEARGRHRWRESRVGIRRGRPRSGNHPGSMLRRMIAKAQRKSCIWLASCNKTLACPISSLVVFIGELPHNSFMKSQNKI